VDFDWLADVDGQFYDDLGEPIPAAEIRLISAAEQLAAYIVWRIEVDAEYGPLTQISTIGDFADLDRPGGTELQHLSPKAECISWAYEAATYAVRLSDGVSLNAKEMEKVSRFDLAAFGSMGGKARYAPMRMLEDWAVGQYMAGTWKSADRAADLLAPDVLTHSKKIGAHLTPTNARRTLSKWFRNAAKSRAHWANLINPNLAHD
jgi:hypothetical protein